MKNDFNRVTKSDMPLDSESVQSRSSSTTKPKTTEIKPKITKIGSGTAKKTPTKTTTTKTTVTKTTTTKTVKATPEEKVEKKPSKPKKPEVVEEKKEPAVPKEKKSKKLTEEKISNQDLEKLNEEKIQSHSFRSTRNKVIIVMLVVLILISVIGVALYAMTLKSDANCFLYMNKKGNVNASFIVEKQQITEFRTPNGLTGNRTFEVDINLKISSGGDYKISFYYECYLGDELMQNILPYEPNREMFRKNNSTNTFESIGTIKGYQTIDIMEGVAIDARYVNRVNPNNFKFKLYLTIEKV